MNQFDLISQILHTKKHCDAVDGVEDASAFLLQRWLSMHSPQIAAITNAMFNHHYRAWTDKQHWYDTLFAIMPKLPYKRLTYIKKVKVEKPKDSAHAETACVLADMLQISLREAIDYLKRDKALAEQMERDVEAYKSVR